MAIVKLVLLCCLVFFFHHASAQNLTTNFYRNSCPNLEGIVSQTTSKIISTTPSLAPSLLRLHFHDCFVRGCDGSVLLNSTSSNTAEKDAIPNLSLRGFQVIDAVKAAVEKQCPERVSCADILALAARAAVVQIKGPSWPVPLGRRDGTVSISNEALANLPPPFFNIIQLIASFATKGLSVKDLVVLSGGLGYVSTYRMAGSELSLFFREEVWSILHSILICAIISTGGHTIGVSLCSSFATRIYNFTGRNDSDPSMDPIYVAALKRACPPADTTTTVAMDPGSAQDFDVDYYSVVRRGRGLFQTDAALLDNSATNSYIQQHSAPSGSNSFFEDFAASMVKMGQIGVLTGSAGQIRKICSVVN